MYVLQLKAFVFKVLSNPNHSLILNTDLHKGGHNYVIDYGI